MIERHIALHLREVCDILETASDEFFYGEIDRISRKIPLLSREVGYGSVSGGFLHHRAHRCHPFLPVNDHVRETRIPVGE